MLDSQHAQGETQQSALTLSQSCTSWQPNKRIGQSSWGVSQRSSVGLTLQGVGCNSIYVSTFDDQSLPAIISAQHILMKGVGCNSIYVSTFDDQSPHAITSAQRGHLVRKHITYDLFGGHLIQKQNICY
eukprot:1161042-Pelagomonas_calceolata.AAC.7